MAETILNGVIETDPLLSTIVLRVSGDHYEGAPRFQLYVDGQPVGEPQTVSAIRSRNEWQEIAFTGDFGAEGPGEVAVRFLNDDWDGSADRDRNLYVDSIEVNGRRFEAEDPTCTVYECDSGRTLSGQEKMSWQGTLTFETEGAAPPAPDTIVLRVSGDHYEGAPRFQLYVDGEAVGEPQTVTADRSAGEWQEFTFSGAFGAEGPGEVAVRFLNDKWGGAPDKDRNLYVDSIEVNGVRLEAEDAVYRSHHGDMSDRQKMSWQGDMVFGTTDAPGSQAPDPTPPTLEVAAAKGGEDYAIALDITASLPGTDGGEPLTVTISGLPEGAGLSAGTDNGDGSWTLTPADLAGLKFLPPENASGSFALDVSATSVTAAGTPVETTATLPITVVPLADLPGLSVPKTLQVQASATDEVSAPLDLSAALTDQDGSETLTVVIGGLPQGAGLSAGTRNSDGDWVLTAAQLQGLRLVLPADIEGDFSLSVTARAEETANGHSATRMKWIDVDVVPPASAPDPSESTIVLRVSGDHYEGAPRFQLYVDGEAVGEPQTVTADRSAGEWQEFTFSGAFGAEGPGEVAVRFLNDKWGGTPDKDRNLHVDYIEVDGQRYEAEDGSQTTYVRDNGKILDGQEKMSWGGKLVVDLDGSSDDEPPAETHPPDDGGDATPPSNGDDDPNPPDTEIPQPSGPAEIVGVRVEGSDGGRVVTFGQVFAPGDVPAGAGLVARIDGEAVPLQVDVKATHADGSVRHAVLSLEAPAGGAAVMLARGAAAPAPALDVAAALAASGYDLALTVAGETVDVAGLVAEALAAGTAEVWLAGPLATEVRVAAPLAAADHLRAVFDVRVHADGSVRTDVAVAYEGTYAMGMENLTYDAAIAAGGRTVARHDGLEHHHHATWHEVVWTGAGGAAGGAPDLHVARDVPYLIATGAVPGYDSSIPVSGAALDGALAALAGADTGPMGSALVETGMPNTGGRPDIGPLPTWHARYLLSQDPRAEAVMLATADAAGSIPWHFRDEATGEYVRIDDHPRLWIDWRGADGRYGEDALPEPYAPSAAGWHPDVAHQPALSYLPYLVTGSRYYLDELVAQASWTMAAFLPPPWRGYERGILDASQVRAKAWALRELADAAYITPDGHALKGYFGELLDNNLEHFVRKYVAEGYMADAGEVEGWVPGSVKAGHTAPWQTDFVAIVMNTLVQRGHAEAEPMLEWMTNFIAGRFLNGENGYDPFQGAPYLLKVFDPETGEKYSTWAEVFEATWGDAPPTGNTLGAGYAFSYGAIAKAALASLISATGSAEAVEAYGFAVANSTNFWDKYDEDPTWNIAPRLADGSYLLHADIHLGSGRMEGGARNELLHGGAGADELRGGGGIDLLYGGAGDDRLFGGAGDDWLFGGAGADELAGGPGDDRLKGGGGADRFAFDPAEPGHDVVLDFTPGVDRLAVAGADPAALLAGAGADADGNAVLRLAPDAAVTLIGVDPDQLSPDSVETAS